MRRSKAVGAALLSTVTFVACGEIPTGAGGEDVALQVARGHAAFERECAGCHASGDGLDLAFFNFTDTTIIRRAVAHVDTATARDIVAYIHTLSAPRLGRDFRLFQPGGAILAGDIPFANQLFGGDIWPVWLTTEQLRAGDPLKLKAAVPLPLWSVERQNVDWMPDSTLPAAILDDQGGRARAAVAAYRLNPSNANLIKAVSALRSADRRAANTGAPCLLDSLTRVNYQQCFQVRRWTASLAGQHMIRYGITGRFDRSVHDVWWEVGNVARKAVSQRVSFGNAERIWAEWMYLGWVFEPASFASTYTGNGLLKLGLPRHATFVALRSEVVRSRGSLAPYADVESAARFAPVHWTFNAIRFGLNHLLERQGSGDLPSPEMRADARTRIENAFAAANVKLTAVQRADVRQLADRVLAGL
ncbi:MAG: hypothetical protein HY560_05770 [Gemmatimonadetes bacterium]|nr:hypothetical protein [Gemmatimonadota bacterium]